MQAVLRTALLQPLLLNSAHHFAGPLGAACSLQTHAPSVGHSIVEKGHDGQQQTRSTVGLPASRHTAVGQGHFTGFSSGYASSSEVTTTTSGNSWAKFRAPYGFEQKSSLGPAMYLTIGVFGFSMYSNDLIYQPPRVAAMLALMMLLMYVRK